MSTRRVVATNVRTQDKTQHKNVVEMSRDGDNVTIVDKKGRTFVYSTHTHSVVDIPRTIPWALIIITLLIIGGGAYAAFAVSG